MNAVELVRVEVPLIDPNGDVGTHRGSAWAWCLPNGQFHRQDGPAYDDTDGTVAWYRNGKLHRDGAPAWVNETTESEQWWFNGLLHRHDGPARTTGPNGDITEWWLHGQAHRENGPAYVEVGGSAAWYRNGVLHREDGPAVLDFDEGTISGGPRESSTARTGLRG